jgi:hypothetical protein
MTLAQIDKWLWLAIYGGIVVGVLGLATHGRDALLGWGLAAAGVLLIAGGVVMIFWRARAKDD